MDFSELDKVVQRYLGNCVAPSTRAAYSSVVCRYHNFCNRFNIQNPFPLTESILCRFVAFLGKEGLKHRSLKVYLSGLRFFTNSSSSRQSIPQGLHACPLLDYMLAGIKQAESRVASHTDPRLPITIQVFRSLKLVWLSLPPIQRASCYGLLPVRGSLTSSGQGNSPFLPLGLTQCQCPSQP